MKHFWLITAVLMINLNMWDHERTSCVWDYVSSFVVTFSRRDISDDGKGCVIYGVSTDNNSLSVCNCHRVGRHLEGTSGRKQQLNRKY